MIDVKSERKSNFELMRVISMFFIVLWHVLLHTNIIQNSSGTLNYLSSFLYILISVHVNSFVLVTGYFQYNKTMKFRKVGNLIGKVWFYNLLFVILTLIIGFMSVDNLEIVQSTSILNMGGYWFINSYVALYLITPLLNKFISKATQKEHKKILIILFIVFSVVATLTKQQTITNDGRTIIAFIFLYLVGAYFGKYPIQHSYHFRNNSKNKNQLIFFSLFLFLGILNFVGYHFGQSLLESSNSLIQDFGRTLVTSIDNFSSPILVIQSVCYLLYFETLTIKSRAINHLSSLTFGIYLVHENKYVCSYIYPRFFEPITNFTGSGILVKLFIVAIVMFGISAIIEFGRQITTKFLCKLSFIKKINQRITHYIENF